jgi:hypothetical protein
LALASKLASFVPFAPASSVVVIADGDQFSIDRPGNAGDFLLMTFNKGCAGFIDRDGVLKSSRQAHARIGAAEAGSSCEERCTGRGKINWESLHRGL